MTSPSHILVSNPPSAPAGHGSFTPMGSSALPLLLLLLSRTLSQKSNGTAKISILSTVRILENVTFLVFSHPTGSFYTYCIDVQSHRFWSDLLSRSKSSMIIHFGHSSPPRHNDPIQASSTKSCWQCFPSHTHTYLHLASNSLNKTLMLFQKKPCFHWSWALNLGHIAKKYNPQNLASKAIKIKLVNQKNSLTRWVTCVISIKHKPIC